MEAARAWANRERERQAQRHQYCGLGGPRGNPDLLRGDDLEGMPAACADCGVYHFRMPRRTNRHQRIVYFLKQHFAVEGVSVTESKMLADLDTGELREVDVVVELSRPGIGDCSFP